MRLLRRSIRLRRLAGLALAAGLAFLAANHMLTHHQDDFAIGESDKVVSLMSQIGYVVVGDVTI